MYSNQNETSEQLEDTSSDRSPGSQRSELSEPPPKSLSNTNISETSSLANQQPEPISSVLETLRTEVVFLTIQKIQTILRHLSRIKKGDIEIHKKPLDGSKDDWDYKSTKQKLEETSPAPESGSPKDSKPSPTSSDEGAKPIPPPAPSTGIKPNPTPANKEVVPSTSTTDKRKEPDGKKIEKVVVDSLY
ncbi:hypothetical protein U1Q18_049926 [Sarracenia purpurea var. burkii]